MRSRLQWRDERGQILILTSATIIAILFLGTVVVDVGNWYIHRRHLQTQVDAAALAAASDFTGCFLTDQSAANTNVTDASLLYAGDINRQPLAFNQQVKPDTGGGAGIHIVLNADAYWPTATNDGWTTANPLGWNSPIPANANAQKPCTVKYIDVKATDDDVPGLFRLIPFRPDIHANARVEIRKGVGFTGVLPWAVPEVDPQAVYAIFFDEVSGNFISIHQLTKVPGVGSPPTLPNISGEQMQTWTNAAASVATTGRTGMIVMTSQSASPNTSFTTVSALCSQPAFGVACYAGSSGSASESLALIRTGLGGGVGTATQPKLKSADFSSACTASQNGYFPLDDCALKFSADIDFGLAAGVNPVLSPTFARVTLQGPSGSGCPCPLGWSTSQQKWILPTGQTIPIAADSGQNGYDLDWRTGTSPGGATLASFTQPEGGSGPARTLAIAGAAAATATVKKVVINDDGGTKTAANFSFTVDGGAVIPFNASGTNTITFNGNNHDVVEVPVAGYATTYSAGCGKVGDGDTCTITNNDLGKGTLLVSKVVTNDDGGTKTASDFSFRINGGAATPFAAGGTNTLSLDEGTIVDVTEPAVTGYFVSATNGCTNVTIVKGATKTCTITNNDDSTGQLTIKKVVINDGLGTKVASDFAFQVDGGSTTGFIPVAGQPLQGQNVINLPVGTHSVTEPAVAGYTNSFSGCTNITIVKGTPKTCTITNDDNPTGTLIVAKAVVNDDGGSAVPGAWTMEIRQGGTLIDSFPGSAAGTSRVLPTGTYTITESGGPAGYTLSYPSAGNCSSTGDITIGAGQTRTCNLRNNDNAGGGGAPASGTFTLVGRPYAADAAAGPVRYVDIGSTEQPSLKGFYLPTSGTHIVSVTVGLEPSFAAATSLTDPPVTLRFGQGSRTQLLDCDHSPRNPDDEIATGCFTGYASSKTGDCSAYGSGGSTLPPSEYVNDPTPTCVAVANGSAVGPTTQGLHRRFELPDCGAHMNNWQPGSIPDPLDSRYVVLVLTDYDTFSGGGAGKVPVRRFAGFYVTGWSSASTGCANAANNEAPPAGTTFSGNKAEVWGHFVNYVADSSNGDPGDDLCAFNESELCVALLTR